MTVLSRRQLVLGSLAGTAGSFLLAGCDSSPSSPAGASGAPNALTGTPTVESVTVPAGGSQPLTATTRTKTLTIGAGGSFSVPPGKSLTITVDGVERAQRFARAADAAPVLVPGTYTGDVVLALTDTSPIAFQGTTFPFRQAVYVDGGGVVAARSVPSAVLAGTVGSTASKGLRLESSADGFNGIVVAGGSYTLTDARITLTGNGRCDFVGYGAAVMSTGKGTRLVVEGGEIRTKGAVRTAVVADGGSNLVVKNAVIEVEDGTLPADYVPSVNLTTMQAVPWMLGLTGNARATNVTGVGTRSTYIACTVGSQRWGVLSTDNDENVELTAINTDVHVSGPDGYGSYCNGSATLRFLGTRFTAPSYGIIATGGSIALGDSTTENVAALDRSLGLGLSTAERSALTPRATTIDSGRFGLMWHGPGKGSVAGSTRITSKEAVFLNKGQQVALEVDGSGGVRLEAANGTLLQLMTNDDPGPVTTDGVPLNIGVYHEPTLPATRVPRFDTTTLGPTDSTAVLRRITLRGNVYNSFLGGPLPPATATPTPTPTTASPSGTTAPGADAALPGGPALVEGMNLGLTLDATSLTGVISASRAAHGVATISVENYGEIGRITNTVQPVVNNGVLVALTNGSTWTVTGPCHLSGLTVDATSKLVASSGTLTVTLDGRSVPFDPGTSYRGAITVTPS